MKVQIENGPLINLTKSDFLSSGGEGEIYIKGQDAYKIYTDFNKMLPLGKIKELSVIKNQNVIIPKNIILNTKHKPIGYTMTFVRDTLSLVQLFTKAFREREGLSHDIMRELIRKFQLLISEIHKCNILVVDLNEMNFLVNKKFDQIYAIDTDSYQTPSYPATAIMDSIRDRHSKSFSEGTDWFAFAILSFQMFIGIHPYEGKHDTVKNINDRMLKNISVLNKNVRTPHVCYPLSVIPKTYLNWYKALFENGKRLPPPNSFDPVVIELSTRIISQTNNFDISEIGEYEGSIIDIQTRENIRVLTNKYFYTTKTKKTPVENNTKIGWFLKSKKPVLANLNNFKLKLFDVENKKEINNQIAGTDIMVSNGCFYIKNLNNLLYIEMIELNNGIFLVASKIVANILENASVLFDAVVVQNLLGAQYISFFPEPTVHKQVHIKELDEYRIIDAKYSNHIFMACLLKNGKYRRVTVRFSKNWSNYDLFFGKEDISPIIINFAVLDNGIVVSIARDGELHVFSNDTVKNINKVIHDPIIGNDMKLFSIGPKVVFSKDNKLFSFSMRV